MPGFATVPNPNKSKEVDFRDSLMYGDILDDQTSINYKNPSGNSYPSVIGSVRIALNEIYLPLLKSGLVNESWPEMLKLDA